MPKHVEKDQDMAAAGLSPEEMAALEEEDAEGTGKDSDQKAATDKDGDGAKAKSESEALPQAADKDDAGAVADPTKKADAKADDKKVDDKKVDDKKADGKDDGKKEVDAAADKATAADGKDDGEAAAADAAASTDDAAAAAKPSEGDGEDVSAPPPPLQVDSFRAQLAARGIPEDYEDQLKATNEAIDALDEKLTEGTIDYAAHAKENRALTTKLADLTAVKREAEFVAGNNEVIADQHWDWEVERFVEENPEFKNPVVYGALRGGLEDLYADEKNAGQAYRWFLREAASKVREAFNMEKKAVPADEGKKDEEVSRTEEIQKEHKDKPQDPPPQTLANVPAAAAEEESQDEFAQLDKMEGMELEAELSKLPKEKVDKYLDTRAY